jgi:hypothetical protein
MKHLLPKARRRVGRVTAAAIVGALALAIAATSASAASQLEWSLENAYSSGCSTSGLHCTWLGYMTNPAPGSGTRGTVAPTGAAVGPTVTGAAPSPSLRGANVFYAWSFPYNDGTGESYNGGAATYEFDGGMSFTSPAPPNGHGITITVVDPEVVVDGDGTGSLYAEGLKATGVGTTAPYDRTLPVFDLDFSDAIVQFNPDGSQSVVGIVPSIHEADYAFPANYAAGDGPNRTPNTFGSFALRFNVDADAGPTGPGGPAGPTGASGSDGTNGADGAAGAAGATGAKGDKGDRGTRGRRGKRGKRGPRGFRGKVKVVAKRSQLVRLAKAPFGKKARSVLLKRNGRTIAYGRIKGRTVRLKLPNAASSKLRGGYVLRAVGSSRYAGVRLG